MRILVSFVYFRGINIMYREIRFIFILKKYICWERGVEGNNDSCIDVVNVIRE